MGEREHTLFVVDDDSATHAQLRAITATLDLRYAAFSSARAFLGAYKPLAPRLPAVGS